VETNCRSQWKVAPRWVVVGAALALAGCNSSNKHFVLVHGAWMGAWAWTDVAAQLEAKGASVQTVELPAHGADTTPPTQVTLDSYVAAVVAAVDAAPSKPILVGHSMGGVVISQAAEQRASKLAELVYVAGFLPKNGDSLQSLSGADQGSHLGPALVINQSAGTASVPSAQRQDIFCADCSTSELNTLQTNYRDEPLAPFGQPVQLTDANFGSVKKFYVYTSNDHAISYGFQQQMTTGVSLSASKVLATSHSPFLSDSEEVATTLTGW
jgi:pimeloyl-ACP methyl ester carboxylesterase